MSAELGASHEITRISHSTCGVGAWSWMFGLLEETPSESAPDQDGMVKISPEKEKQIWLKSDTTEMLLDMLHSNFSKSCTENSGC